jgi:hypothetical protein
MVINNLDFIGIAIIPDKAYAPLHIDADGMLANAILAKLMQPVAWQKPEGFNACRRMQNLQPSPGLRLKCLESTNRPIMKQRFSAATFERFDHCRIVFRISQ